MNAPTSIAWVEQIALAISDGAARTSFLACSDGSERPSCAGHPGRHSQRLHLQELSLSTSRAGLHRALHSSPRASDVPGHVEGADDLLFLDEEATSPSWRHLPPAWSAQSDVGIDDCVMMG